MVFLSSAMLTHCSECAHRHEEQAKSGVDKNEQYFTKWWAGAQLCDDCYEMQTERLLHPTNDSCYYLRAGAQTTHALKTN
jgi:hypothetical protein